jgi:hypothetical protein
MGIKYHLMENQPFDNILTSDSYGDKEGYAMK